MAIKFEELRKYMARNVRLSICFEDGYYHDYLMMSDIPEQKYAGFYIYGVGMVDVEFSRDVYAALPEPEGECWCRKDDTMKPAMELMISEEPRDIKRSVEQKLLFRDLKPYLQIGRHFSIVNRNDWSSEYYEYRSEIPEKYDDMYVYGIGMEECPHVEKMWMDVQYETVHRKQMVIVLSNQPREDLRTE